MGRRMNVKRKMHFILLIINVSFVIFVRLKLLFCSMLPLSGLAVGLLYPTRGLGVDRLLLILFAQPE